MKQSKGDGMPGGDETRETYRFADDDDSDDLGGFGRGKRSYDDDEDEENGGWAINEDHSDRLWDSADDVDDDDEEESVATDADDVDDDEEEEDVFGGGAPRGRRGRPKGSTAANREKQLLAATRPSREAPTELVAENSLLFGDDDASLTDESASGPPAAVNKKAGWSKSGAKLASKAASGASSKKSAPKKAAAKKVAAKKPARRKPAPKKAASKSTAKKKSSTRGAAKKKSGSSARKASSGRRR